MPLSIIGINQFNIANGYCTLNFKHSLRQKLKIRLNDRIFKRIVKRSLLLCALKKMDFNTEIREMNKKKSQKPCTQNKTRKKTRHNISCDNRIKLYIGELK